MENLNLSSIQIVASTKYKYPSDMNIKKIPVDKYNNQCVQLILCYIMNIIKIVPIQIISLKIIEHYYVNYYTKKKKKNNYNL